MTIKNSDVELRIASLKIQPLQDVDIPIPEILSFYGWLKHQNQNAFIVSKMSH